MTTPVQRGKHSERRWLGFALSFVEIALVFVIFTLHGAWPTPDVNETNYILKALRFWQPDVYPGDFFLGTADAHSGYYWAFGWLTQWISLDAAAWCGRIATWLLLAISWRGLSYAVLPIRWVAVLSAQLLVMLNEQSHMAGEWFVGGVEGKGFAYALLFFSLHALVIGRWRLAWILLGPATLLHAVVGVWSMACLAIAWLATPRERPRLAEMIPAMAIAVLLAAPAIWNGLQLNRGIDPEVAAQAARIQVEERLPHHLQPLKFREGYIQRFSLLAVVYLLVCGATPAAASDRRLRWFVAGSLLIALAGLLIAWLSDLAAHDSSSVLRFYWFRLADTMTPLGVSLVGLQYVFTLRDANRRIHWLWLAALLTLSLYDLSNQLRHVPGLSQGPTATAPRSHRNVVHEDWLDVCRWAANNTPPGSLFITPRASYTFKWLTRQEDTPDSGRGEVANWKDMPQDGQKIIEWWNRLHEIYGTGNPDPKQRWHDSLAAAGPEHLQAMADKYGAQYAIVERLPHVPALPLNPVYENASYSVYHFDSDGAP